MYLFLFYLFYQSKHYYMKQNIRNKNIMECFLYMTIKYSLVRNISYYMQIPFLCNFMNLREDTTRGIGRELGIYASPRRKAISSPIVGLDSFQTDCLLPRSGFLFAREFIMRTFLTQYLHVSLRKSCHEYLFKI